MPSFRENRRTFTDLLGAEFWAGLIFAIIVAVVGYFLFGEWPPPSEGGALLIPLKFIPTIVAIIGLGIFYFCLVLNRATKYRLELQSLTDMEIAVDYLSELFDQGNNTILNRDGVDSPIKYGSWKNDWERWQERVQEHLEEAFGRRERNVFTNLVLYKKHNLGGVNDEHITDKAMLAAQLQTLRKIIIRYSERAARWRCSNT